MDGQDGQDEEETMNDERGMMKGSKSFQFIVSFRLLRLSFILLILSIHVNFVFL